MKPESRDPADPSKPLDGVRPRGGLLRKKMRAALAEKMFGVPAEPTRIGRFVILERLGQGGMGDVYSAYDPKLDRRVALKLLRVDSARNGKDARDRLEREAVALARLSHPNVVPVHDVGVIPPDPGSPHSTDEQMFIVMELVEGKTLAAWVEAEPRSWREIVDAYVQAGQGLAAAHAVGLVHRDFKPQNVQVGADGRIRVLDFGLARAAAGIATDDDAESGEAAKTRIGNPDDVDAMAETVEGERDGTDEGASSEAAPAAPSSAQGPLHTPLTRTGAVLGTPAYMSPEQFTGRHAGPASDQFSFCVALFEALYGCRPFAGSTFQEIAESTLAGRIAPQPRASNAPGWLYPILARGLSRRPAERHPSMSALLAELGRDPARIRRRRMQIGLLAALVAAVVGLSVKTFTNAKPVEDPCSGARAELAGYFDEAERARLKDVFQGIDHPYAKHVWPRVEGELGQYAKQWATMHEEACRAHRRGEQSGELLDRRMACLERRRRALGSAVTVLAETRKETLDGAVDVVQKLPDIHACADATALLAEVPPPEDAETARRVSELRSRASRAQALSDAGRYREALDAVSPLVDLAEPLGYRPLSAELHLLQGQLRWSLHDNHAAMETLRKAAELGISAGMFDLGVESVARLIYAEGVTNDGAGALARVSLFEALSERTPKQSFARALLYNNVGIVYRARQEPERAREYFERALAARAPHDGRVELSLIGYNLVLVTDDYGRRDALLREALSEIERQVGRTHPRALNQRIISAPHVLSPVEAHAMLEPACAQYASVHPELLAQRGKCLRILADLEVELGRNESAAKRYAEAARLLTEGGESKMSKQFGTIALGLGALYGGDGKRAIAILEPLLERLDGPAVERKRPLQWWERQPIATAALGLGLAYLATNDPAAAISPLERARESLEKLLEQAPSVARRQQLARARTALARASCPAPEHAPNAATRERCARAKVLEDEARAWYREAGPGYEHTLREP